MQSYDLNLLRVLDAVLSTGSVTLAARRLHLSVPATSHALARLRRVVGDPLLVRAGRQLVPTARALALREPVAQWIAQAQGLITGGDQVDLASVQRAFVVRAPEGIAIAFGAQLAQGLRENMPRATLTFIPETVDDPAALRDGRVDLDLGPFQPREPELERVELLRYRQVAVVRQGHALDRQSSLSARRYAQAVHVGVARRGGEPSLIDDALAARGLARDVVLTVAQSNVAALIAARSDLVATISERVAIAMAPSLDLKILSLSFAQPAQAMVLAWHPRQSADPAHRWLRSRLLALFADMPAPARGPI